MMSRRRRWPNAMPQPCPRVIHPRSRCTRLSMPLLRPPPGRHPLSALPGVLSRPARILSAFAPTRLATASRDEPAAAAAAAPEAASRAIGTIGGGTLKPARPQLRAPHEVSARMRVGDAEPSTPESEAVRLHALSLHRSARRRALL